MLYSGPGFISYRGRPALQSDSIKMSVKSGDSRVKTLLLGDAGHSAGAEGVSITVSNGIPQAGLEIDWVGLCLSHEEIPLSFHLAGKVYNLEGNVSDAELDTGVDKANVSSMTYTARVVGVV